METEAILKEFNEHLERYATHRGYIERARGHAHKFSSAVVEKVILDHEVKSSEVAEHILPLVPQIQEALGALDTQRKGITERKAGSEEQMEELNLRLAIGELTEDEFKTTSAAFKAELAQAGERLEAIAAEYTLLETALDRWRDLARSADQDPGLAKPRVAAAPVLSIVGQRAEEDVHVTDEGHEGVVVSDQDGVHVSTSGSVEDVSAAFGVDEEPAEVVALDADDGQVDEVSAEIDLGFGDDAGERRVARAAAPLTDQEIDLGFGTGPAEVELAIEGESEGRGVGAAEIEIAADDKGVDNRRALLLYQEGTPEEQIYPFTGEVITVGRGRENDIQIKNDSKVSRYHCKVFRRGANFYIEDNKSSNGTLVNGELITERRLFGGEEVIIGETFFRFRIME